MSHQQVAGYYDAARIRDWIAEEAPEAESLISRLCGECVAVTKAALREAKGHQDVPEPAYRSLERSGSSFILWADGHGIADGNLDEALAKSKSLRKSILELLISIAETLSGETMPHIDPRKENNDRPTVRVKSLVWEAKTAIRDNCESSDTEESDSDASSVSKSDDWEEMADSMRTDVECLIDLDAIIKCPFVDARKTKAIEIRTDEPKPWTPCRLYSDRIGYRFPDAQPELVQRLAQASWGRFRMIRSNKEENIAPATEIASSFHDSELETSLAAGSANGEPTMSYNQKNIGNSIKIPPLTPEAKKGKPFECLACGRQVKIQNDSLWKWHLFNDLRPWICHDISCWHGTQPFESRDSWIRHLVIYHGPADQWDSNQCPLCLKTTGREGEEILEHLSSHFEEIALLSLPASVPSDCNSKSG